jgi:hypothetical protein
MVAQATPPSEWTLESNFSSPTPASCAAAGQQPAGYQSYVATIV